MRLTPVEKQERKDFILNRLKRGFSFLEVHRQFAKHFGCAPDTARKWVNFVCDEIAEQEDPTTRKRTFTVVVEMFHDQIVSYQNDLLGMQREIDTIAKISDRRTQIYEELEAGQTGARHRELIAELKALPDVGTTTKANLIEAKTRIRDRMYRVMCDLARLRGISGVQSDWRQALNTLLDNNLIPPAVAEGILTVIDDFEGNIRAIEATDAPTNLIGIDSLDELEETDDPLE